MCVYMEVRGNRLIAPNAISVHVGWGDPLPLRGVVPPSHPWVEILDGGVGRNSSSGNGLK